MGYVSKNSLDTITKEEVLKAVSQEDIVKYYLGIPEIYKQKFRSPFRKDKHPTCTLKWMGGTLFFRDWAESGSLNCFHLVMRIYECDFINALKIIANDFKLRDYKDIRTGFVPKIRISNPVGGVSSSGGNTKIRVKRQPFRNQDIKYLRSFGISLDTADYFSIASCRKVWINDMLIYQYNSNDPALVYHFGSYNYKIYFYKRETYNRFISNTNLLQGYKQLPKEGDILVITKSLKDVAAFYEFGIRSVAPQSETHLLSKQAYNKLNSRFNKIISVMDFDLAGVRAANLLKKIYGIDPVFVSTDRKSAIKDFSDLIKNNGIYEARKFCEKEIRARIRGN